ncbi:PRTRC system protein E [Bifidobacterium sp. DSM 109959]|uniref:PRTRC system protein E n=2 Tax=Bifidobacterium olomucense TaxID=2675324 RepID=A0A7Y0EXD6_9BIFI|nr:PRTRC system protein E [Bifidobacterium sp. DSM 109959]NMM98166.1 PRTRC system protein E [Bifidobacterium sp. DSM 109959]
MPPFQQLFASSEFWSTLILALVSGGGLGGVVTLIATRNRTRAETEHESAEADKLATEAAHQAVTILTDSVIRPLREQVDLQEAQIDHLEKQQERYFVATGYIRSLCHWLDPAVRAMEPDYMAQHPKPALPDVLREQIAPETIKGKETP